MQTRLGIPSILAGIVTNTGLYTVNLMAMGWKANQSLLGSDTVFTLLRDTGIGGAWYELLLAAAVTLLAGALLLAFLKTRLGLSIRATGDNPDMVRASSLNPAFTITVGLCVSNALTALSGAMVGQYQKTVDINSGTGIVVIGLACLIIGETVLGRRTVARGILAVLIGSVIYRFIYAVVFYTKIVPVECLKLLTAVIVALAIAAPSIRKWAAFQKRKTDRRKGGNGKCLTSDIFPRPSIRGRSTRKRALTDLSLHLDKGEFVTVIGSNGAGKSTLFNAIAGSFYVDAGSIEAGRPGHHLPAGVPAQPAYRPPVPGSPEGDGTPHDHRGKSGAGLRSANGGWFSPAEPEGQRRSSGNVWRFWTWDWRIGCASRWDCSPAASGRR